MTRWIVPKCPGHVAMFLPHVWQTSALEETPSLLSSTPFAAGSLFVWLNISLRHDKTPWKERGIHLDDGHAVHIHSAEYTILDGIHLLGSTRKNNDGTANRGVFLSDTISFTK